jgi:ribosomal protein S12 methylthiotransferase accessory factor
MLERPRFKPHLRVEVVPGEGAFVLSGTGQTLLRGRLYELVVPWVGQGRSADNVCDALEDRASPAEVYYVLGQLEKKGFVCGEDAVAEGESAWWWSQDIDPHDASRRLGAARVAVRSLGVDGQPLRALLGESGVSLVDETDAQLIVAVVDGYRRPGLAELNAKALRDGRPWLLVRPIGRQIWVGPLFRPGVTGCWECLAHRLQANSPVAAYLESRDGRADDRADKWVPDDIAATPATAMIAWGMAANAVANWVVRGELPHLEGKVQTFDPSSGKAESHTIVRLPFCPVCGTSDAAVESSPRSIALERRIKDRTRDGGHRTVSPEVTIQRYGHHVSPITGAVTMLERVGPGADAAADSVLHVYIAGHNFARRHHSLAHIRNDLRHMSSGKGTTDAQARASGLCEGLERYSGVYRGDEVRRRATARRLGDDAIALANCLHFSDRQYRERDAWNARMSHYNFVPAPLDPDTEIDWTPAWSLTRGQPRFLPTAFCYYSVPQPEGGPYCIGDSNGCAAGNTLEEAILQGFLELVERDAVALWWYNRVQRPAVNLASFDDPYLERLMAYLAAHGREMWVLDLTTDLGIPVFTAISRDVEAAEERIMPGFGAHLDPRTALLRAVTEMVQMLAHIPKRGESLAPGGEIDDPETLHWLKTATVANQPYLLADRSAPSHSAASYEQQWTEDVAEDVRRCQGLVEARGMEMIVLDQTRPEIGLPVAKVIVPGLRHFWARFAPGRLYDVPVRLGWLAAPIPEEELNPIPMFL